MSDQVGSLVLRFDHSGFVEGASATKFHTRYCQNTHVHDIPFRFTISGHAMGKKDDVTPHLGSWFGAMRHDSLLWGYHKSYEALNSLNQAGLSYQLPAQIQCDVLIASSEKTIAFCACISLSVQSYAKHSSRFRISQAGTLRSRTFLRQESTTSLNPECAFLTHSFFLVHVMVTNPTGMMEKSDFL